MAVRQQNIDIIRTLVSSCPDNLDEDVDKGDTLLHVAVEIGNAEIVRILVDGGADLNIRNHSNYGSETPLYLAIETGIKSGNTEIVRILVDAGADLEKKSGSGLNPTPLHLAVAAENVEIVRILIDAGAYPNLANHPNYATETPLHRAVEAENVEIVRILLHAGADTTVPNGRGYGRHTPLDYAVSTGNAALVEMLVTAAQTITPRPSPTTTPDREVLIALYNATDGSNWRRTLRWRTDAPIGEWYGVTTDSNGRVTELELGSNSLSGPVPSVLRQLSNLQELNLNQNTLSGTIPPELGQLSNLQVLQLSNNTLSGAIPSELGQLSNLQELNLNQNTLSGAIPPELGQLSNLQVLQLSNNTLSGAIPPELGQLSNLQILLLSNNTLSGAIPLELGQLTKLRRVYLDGNQLTGCVPGGLYEASESDLSDLGLTDCRALGPAPTVPPLPPSNVEVDSQGNYNIVTWDSVQGASYYKVLYCLGRDLSPFNCRNKSDYELIADNVVDTTYQHEDVEQPRISIRYRYFYWIQACNSAGCSESESS